MAYDAELADRIRDRLDGAAAEKKMFGGLAFLVGGHMAVAASGRDGGLMVRCDPAETDTLVAESGVRRMEMQGRELDGWLRLEADRVESDEELGRWVDVGVSYAASLPPK